MKKKDRIERILRTQRKQCQLCKITKPLTEFFKCKKNSDGYGSYCKPCKQNYNNENWRKHKYKHLEARKNNHLIKNYGITLSEYKKILSKQNGLCAICFDKDKERLCVDHDHSTGKVRGLLCDKCNQAIGSFRDDTNIIRRAIIYLRQY